MESGGFDAEECSFCIEDFSGEGVDGPVFLFVFRQVGAGVMSLELWDDLDDSGLSVGDEYDAGSPGERFNGLWERVEGKSGVLLLPLVAVNK